MAEAGQTGPEANSSLFHRKRVVAAGFPPRVHRRCGVRGGDLVHKWWRAGTTVIGIGARAPVHVLCCALSCSLQDITGIPRLLGGEIGACFTGN